MIVSLYAGILALIYVVLSLHIVSKRTRGKVMFGDNNEPDMVRAVRIHGNFAEYVPLALLLLALYETQAGSFYAVHAFGITLVTARIAHIIGLHRDVLIARGIGTFLTLTTVAILGVILILKGITATQVL